VGGLSFAVNIHAGCAKHATVLIEILKTTRLMTLKSLFVWRACVF